MGGIFTGVILTALREGLAVLREIKHISYSGYKKTHVFNVQSIVTPDGMIASLYGPCAGVVNDTQMVRRSGLEDILKGVSYYIVLTDTNMFTDMGRYTRGGSALALRRQGLHR